MEKQKHNNSPSLRAYGLVLVFVVIVVVVVLALLGPTTGNVFSNTLQGLQGG